MAVVATLLWILRQNIFSFLDCVSVSVISKRACIKKMVLFHIAAIGWISPQTGYKIQGTHIYTKLNHTDTCIRSVSDGIRDSWELIAIVILVDFLVYRKTKGGNCLLVPHASCTYATACILPALGCNNTHPRVLLSG